MEQAGPSKIAIIGAGTMGHGIAQVSAQSGYETFLYDLDAGALERAREKIAASQAKGLDRGKLSEEDRSRALANLTFEPTLAEAVAGADLVVEAIVEKLSVKQQLFSTLEGLTGESTILASNTSSIPIARISEACSRPERVIGMHFFNPVPIMALIEIVVHPGTSDATRDAAVSTGRRMGKEPIVVKDSAGFASSRLGVVIALEAMRMLEQGVATAEDIDKAMELGYRHPMGPLRLTDLVGLDVRLAIAETLDSELSGEQYRPPEILRKMVAAGNLGKKTGKGFHDWND